MSIDRYLITGFPRGTSPIKHSVMEKLYKYLGFYLGCCTVYLIKCAHCIVALCFVLVISLFCLMGFSWWRHQMETFSALLVLCAGNSPVNGEFPSQRPVTQIFDVLFDLSLNKRLRRWWFDTPSCSLSRHCNVWVSGGFVWPIYQYTPRLLHWHSGNHMTTSVQWKHPRNILVKPLLNHSKIFISRNCINSYGRVHNGDANIHFTN